MLAWQMRFIYFLLAPPQNSFFCRNFLGGFFGKNRFSTRFNSSIQFIAFHSSIVPSALLVHLFRLITFELLCIVVLRSVFAFPWEERRTRRRHKTRPNQGEPFIRDQKCLYPVLLHFGVHRQGSTFIYKFVSVLNNKSRTNNRKRQKKIETVGDNNPKIYILYFAREERKDKILKSKSWHSTNFL